VLCVALSVGVALLLAVLGLLLGLERLRSENLGALLFSLGNAASVVLALVLVDGRMERRTLAQLGLGRQGALRDLGWGLLLGTALMSAVVGVLALAGWYALVEGRPETFQDEVRDALWWTAIFLVAGFFEEVAFRGIGFRLLEEWLGSAAALVISSAFFGLFHGDNPHVTPFATLAIAVEAGLMLGAAYMLTRSLWFATGLHVAWNWTQGSLFGVAVSGTNVESLLESELVGPQAWTGGDFGAEAGGVALLLGTAVGVLLLVAAVRRGQWVPFLPRRRARQQETPASAA
jgi:hypothetical protein